MKEKKKIVIVCCVIVVFLLLILIAFMSSNKLSDLENKIYEATRNELSNFKDPSSVRIQEIQICGDYARVTISANNSYGARVPSKYVMYTEEKVEKTSNDITSDYSWLRDGNLKSSYDDGNTSQLRILNLKKFELEVSQVCVDTMFDETINYAFTEKQIDTINKKLIK